MNETDKSVHFIQVHFYSMTFSVLTIANHSKKGWDRLLEDCAESSYLVCPSIVYVLFYCLATVCYAEAGFSPSSAYVLDLW